MSLNVLVVGCGSIGERHLRSLIRTKRTQVGACETNAVLLKRTVEQYNVSGFPTLEEALASQKFDGVVICIPANTHVALAVLAIRSGASLLIEKPLSVSFDQIDALEREIAKAQKFVGVAYVYHFVPAVQAARDYLRKGPLGKPLQVAVSSGQHFPTFRPAYREIYYTRHETGGGAIQDALTHLANTVEWLVGPTSRIYCEAAHQALEGVTVEDTVCVAGKNGDVLVGYTLNQFQSPNETCFQIHCERGSLKIEPHAQRWGVFLQGSPDWEYHSEPVKDRDDLFVAQANAFIDGIEGAETALCTIDEAIQTLKFNLAALESARTGKSVVIS
jgi:predicted dehydrogenase